MATLAVSVGFTDILLYMVQSLSNLKYDMNLKHSMQCDAFSTCRMNQGLYTKGVQMFGDAEKPVLMEYSQHMPDY